MKLPPGYTPLKALAERGPTQVILARSERADRLLVFKCLRPALSGDREARAGFIDEARVLAHLNHENVVQLLDHGEFEGLPYHVLEYVDGPNLQHVLHSVGPLPAHIALYVARAVAHALSHVHSADDEHGKSLQVVHRDISPDNIVIDVHGALKLVDFGIARARGRLVQTAVGIAKGKLSFMSPEQLRSETVGSPSDIFSLGCTLHALLTGESPMADDAIRRDVVSGGVVPVGADIAPQVQDVLRYCLHGTPSLRPTAEELADTLDRHVPSLSEGHAALSRLAGVQEPELPTEVLAADEPEPELSATPILVDLESAVIEAAQPVVLPVLEPGAWIGEYRVLGHLGAGGFAEVLEVEHIAFGGRYALKRMLPTGNLRRFRREIEALERIDHPRVVRLVAHGLTEQGEAFLVTDCLDGECLTQHLSRYGALPESVACRLACDIAEGLAAVHEAGLVHRDLSTGNVMVVQQEDEPRAVLVDFGIALLDPGGGRSRITRQGILGTLYFMAPEQLADAHDVTAAADVHALGMLMYCMLVGRPPMSPEQAAAISWIRSGVRPEWPGAMGECLRSAWQREPKARPSAALLAERLSALDGPWLDDRATTPLAPRPVVRVSSSRNLAFAVVVALVALAAGGLAWFMARPTPPAPAVPAIVELPEAQPSRPVVAQPAVPLAPPQDAVAPGAAAEADKKTTPRRRPSKPPVHKKAVRSRPTSVSPRQQLRRLLAARGLQTKDIKLDPDLAPLYRRWQASPVESDKAEAFRQMQEKLQNATLDSTRITRRLKAFRAQLAARASRIEATELQALEQAYLDIVTGLRGGCAPEACRAWAKRLRELERRL